MTDLNNKCKGSIIKNNFETTVIEDWSLSFEASTDEIIEAFEREGWKIVAMAFKNPKNNKVEVGVSEINKEGIENIINILEKLKEGKTSND